NVVNSSGMSITGSHPVAVDVGVRRSGVSRWCSATRCVRRGGMSAVRPAVHVGLFIGGRYRSGPLGQGGASVYPPAGQPIEVPLADQVVVAGEHGLGDVGGAADDAAQLVDVDPRAARVGVEVLRQAGGLQRAVHPPAGAVDAPAPVLLVDLLES